MLILVRFLALCSRADSQRTQDLGQCGHVRASILSSERRNQYYKRKQQKVEVLPEANSQNLRGSCHPRTWTILPVRGKNDCLVTSCADKAKITESEKLEIRRSRGLILKGSLPFFKQIPVYYVEALIWRVSLGNVLLDEVIQLQRVPALPNVPNIQQQYHLSLNLPHRGQIDNGTYCEFSCFCITSQKKASHF